MKRYYTVFFAALLLTGCGNTQNIDSLIAAQEPAASATDIPVTKPAATVPEPSVPVPEASGGEYDIDLTVLDSNMVYAQVYDMVFGDTDYNGKRVRAKGTFAYYQDPQTKKEYFAVLISDAAACCAQGIEFETAEARNYPADYPALGAETVVHGILNVYEDATGTYVQLRDAVIE